MNGSDLATVTRSTIPTITWAPILAASAVMLVIAVATRLDAPDHPLAGLRLATLVLVIGLAFASEDAAADVTAASPVPFRTRCVARAAVPVALATIVWLAAAAIAPLGSDDRRLLGTDLVAMYLLAAVIALIAARLGSTRPGLIVGPLLFATLLLSSRLNHFAILPLDAASLSNPLSLDNAYKRLLLIAAITGPAIVLATRDTARGHVRPANSARQAASVVPQPHSAFPNPDVGGRRDRGAS